ncbi:MAG: sulfatase-like hydrolase/transferase [Bacteroidota bacterium]
MQRKLLVLLCILVICLFMSCTPEPAIEKPNIVWFVSEDNSPYLGTYGDTLARTPNLDALANEGITFTNAFSNAPVCAPSRSTIITGMYPPHLGSQHMRSAVNIADSIRFFPQYLKDADYFTTLRKKRDYNIPAQEGTWDLDDWWNISEAFEGRTPNQPFFMMYNTWMTHEGKIHGRDTGPSYFKVTFQELDSLKVDSMLNAVKTVNRSTVSLPEYLPDLPEARDDLAYYYELMEMLDMEFSYVIQQLEANGELDNTIIIYSSDHGGVLGRSKRFTFESGLHIPMIIKYPKKWAHLAPSAAGTTSDKLVSLIDIGPTVLGMAGLEKPAHMMGYNISEKSHNPDMTFGFRGRMDETYDMVRTLRNKKYRYIRNFHPHRPAGQRINYLWNAANINAWEKAFKAKELDSIAALFFLPKPTEEFYDITKDAANVHNLVEDPELQNQLHTFRVAMDSMLLDIRDTGFIPEGQLWAAHQTQQLTYREYVDKLDFKFIYTAAKKATADPSPSFLATLLESTDPTIRYWGTTGILIQLSRGAKAAIGPAISQTLTTLLDDPSGDVAVNTAEILIILNQSETAKKRLSELVLDDNPFVSLRACNAIAALPFTLEELGVAEALETLLKKEEKGGYDYAIRKAKHLMYPELHFQ